MSNRTVRMSSGGRLVVPAELRREFGLEEGVPVVFGRENGKMTVVSLADSVRRAQELFATRAKPGVSIVDELIADRRAAAARGD
jgi:bifunctional DNA-binding transcriptional regulator/antitoxin component of YhaV-PrlF toxin-antitoxin module